MPVGDGLADPEGVADGEHEVAHLQGLGVAELQDVQIRCVAQAQNRKVRAGIAQHDLGLELPPVGERDPDLRHPLDDMVVRDHETGGIHDDAGPDRGGRATPRGAGVVLAEVAAEELLHGVRLPAALRPGGAVDVDDREARLAGDGGEGELNLTLLSGTARCWAAAGPATSSSAGRASLTKREIADESMANPFGLQREMNRRSPAEARRASGPAAVRGRSAKRASSALFTYWLATIAPLRKRRGRMHRIRMTGSVVTACTHRGGS
jgi:hypothetical protein